MIHDSSRMYQLPDSLLSNTPATSCNYNKLPSLIHKRWQVAVAVPHLKFIIYSELNKWYPREAVKNTSILRSG